MSESKLSKLHSILLEEEVYAHVVTHLGPISWIDFAAERMSATVSNDTPPSKADASFRLGVTMSAIGRRSCLLEGSEYRSYAALPTVRETANKWTSDRRFWDISILQRNTIQSQKKI